MIAEELGHVFDDGDQVLLHLFVPDHLQVGLVAVFQGILGTFKIYKTRPLLYD
jgi:hypothetical protein